MERRCPYPRRSAGRARRQAATANPQKSADAIVAETLKLVGLGEGQNLTKRATTLDYPMKEERQKTQESCPQNDSAERESYEGAQTLIGMVGDDLVEVRLTSGRMLEYILTPDNLNRAYIQVKANEGSGGIDKMDVHETGTWYLFHNDFPNSYACVAYFIPLIISRLPAANTSGPSPGRWRRHQHIWQYHR